MNNLLEIDGIAQAASIKSKNIFFYMKYVILSLNLLLLGFRKRAGATCVGDF